jgi:hypothetical protein
VKPELRGGSACAGPPRRFLARHVLRALVGATAFVALTCAARPDRPPDPNLAKVWRDYRRMPDQRALAIAGNVKQDRFVSGAAGGHATAPAAEAAAMQECAARRLRMRQQAQCQLYAVGDEIVWPGP